LHSFCSVQEKPLCRPLDFDPVTFKEQFRFNHAEFQELMSSLCDLDGHSLADANGNPRLLRRIGKHSKDMIACWADSALLVFLRRFSRHAAWMDLQMILGGSRAELSRIFSYMMRMLYKRYAPLVRDIHVWKEHLALFADHMVNLGMPFDGTVGFLDGKVVETARPGGQGCVYFNFQDFEVRFPFFANSCKIQGFGIQKQTVNEPLCCTLTHIYTVLGLHYNIQYHISEKCCVLWASIDSL
jgi:hypothetical protein